MNRGRLIGMSCYLCGPIDKCPEGGAPWRERLTPLLNEMGIVVLDPLRKPVNSGLEDDDHRAVRRMLLHDGRYDEFREIMKKVRAVDLRLVDHADFLVVYYDTAVAMCGTYEELFLANRQKKPVLLVCPQGLMAINDWLWGTLPHREFFDNFESVLSYIRAINAGDTPFSNRWVFIEPNKAYTPRVLDVLLGVTSGV